MRALMFSGTARAAFNHATRKATKGACDSWRASLQRALICGEKGYLIGDLRTVRVQHARYASTADNGCDASQQGSFFGAYTPVTKALWKRRLEYLGVARDRELPPIVEKSAEPISVTYPFTTDTEFLEMYRNPWNRIRIGRVLEDMDSLAGNIAFAHTDDGNPDTMPPMLVTAAVERIQMLYPVDLAHDVTLSGQVVYTGSSSLDIRLTLGQTHRDAPSITALVTFVARDPATGRATRVNPLVPDTDEQRRWYAERQEVARVRKAARAAASAAPGGTAGGPDEHATRRAWAQRLLTEARAMRTMPGLAAGDALLMDSTRLSNTFTCQPQQRNMHGRVFGGFLMRRAYELAFATVHMFAGSRPRFVQVDRVDFKMPVDIGDLLSFRSCVMHSRNLLDHPEGARGQVFVQVEASVNRPEQGTSATTNTFSFTFETDLSAAADAPGGRGAAVRTLKRVLPATAQQARDVEKFCPRHYSIE